MSYQNSSQEAEIDELEFVNGFLENYHGHLEKKNCGFLLISFFHFVSAFYLFHQETFVGVTNAVFLVIATFFIVACEVYQPVAMKPFFLSWNQYPVRGCVLMWLSANALWGSIIFGTLAFFCSVFVLIPIFISIAKIDGEGEDEECKHSS